MDNLLEQGIAAYKAEKRDEARKIFIAFERLTLNKTNFYLEHLWQTVT